MALCSDCKQRPTISPTCTQCQVCWDEEGKWIAELYGRSTEQLKADILDSIKKIEDKIPAQNDHVCPHCKNDKVSKKETSCWKCGGNLR